jgi:hypothetical protein
MGRFLEHAIRQCIDANLLDGEIIHIDSSTIRVDASRDKGLNKPKLISENLYNELDKNTKDESENSQKISKTDPNAGFGKKKGSPSVLGYKNHRDVDDRHGIITAIITTAANIRMDFRRPDATGLKKSLYKTY